MKLPSPDGTIKDASSERGTDAEQRSARICPYCKITFSSEGVSTDHQSLRFADIRSIIHGGETKGPRDQNFTISSHRCPDCLGQIIWMNTIEDQNEGHGDSNPQVVETTLLFPKYVQPKVPDGVSDNLVRDYQEAFQTLEISPKASAALSRRCLQNTIRSQANINKGTLFQEVEELLKTGRLPQYLAEELDYIRVVGNFAAHPTKDSNTGEIVDVAPDEAVFTLEVLEKLLKFFFVDEPASKQRRALVADKHRRSGGKGILGP